MLRDYQQKSVDLVMESLALGKLRPCLVLPTGAGKSHVVAALIKRIIGEFPDRRVIMLTHTKELIAQNAEKMLMHWPDAPLGIYSAGLGRKEINQITFAGIQSLGRNPHLAVGASAIIVDECHLINAAEQGLYRNLIDLCQQNNTDLAVIGLTATPYRLGTGYIAGPGCFFDSLLEPVSLLSLVEQNYLAPLKSKASDIKINLMNVRKQKGEFREDDLDKVINSEYMNEQVASAIKRIGEDRKAWLVFCVGVSHAKNMAEMFSLHGVNAACITGDTPKNERDHILNEFKKGSIQAVTNANVLTTGFDYPDIDLIAMLRPTMSTALYVQMAGRGMRIKSEAKDCIVLDFVGNVGRHGPITDVQVKTQTQKADPPTKTCPQCAEIVLLSKPICTACGYEWPAPEVKKYQRLYALSNDDILGGANKPKEIEIHRWRWKKTISKATNIPMVAITYYPEDIREEIITEYLTLLHDGFAGVKAKKKLDAIFYANKKMYFNAWDLEDVVDRGNALRAPMSIMVRKAGKFFEVLERKF